ncbi:MAG: hypothetical protein EBX72_10850, partial [Betaproteobacteria bacterium]|nr:hypothetical protein [Betaproteobacteria bacterium]
MPAQTVTASQFVSWLRSVAPYIHNFRNRTFVVGFPGELVQAGRLNALIQDIALLTALGIRIVVVHGCKPQVEEQLRLRGLEGRFAQGMRITRIAELAIGVLGRPCEKAASISRRISPEASL